VRIALVCPPWYFFYGCELASELAASHDVLFVADQHYDALVTDLGFQSNFPIERISWLPMRSGFMSNVASLNRIRNAIASFKPDVVHVQEGDRRVPLLYPFLRGVPLVLDIHNPLPLPGSQHAALDAFRDWLSTSAGSILVHGHAMKQLFTERTRLPRQHIFVLPFGKFRVFGEHPICSGARPNVSGRSRPVNILFFGRVEPYKGLKYLFRAEPLLARLAKHEYRVQIVGQGNLNALWNDPLDPDIYEIVAQRVRSPAPYFASADIVVQPYEDGSTSGVTPVAYAFNRPVVSTNVGSLSETVIDGVTGKVVPPCDARRLAEALSQLVNEPEARFAMGTAGRRLLEGPLSWHHNIRTVEDAYQHAVQRQRTQR
jgi:glycosyltransferase involved in cell wall biosynthesis